MQGSTKNKADLMLLSAVCAQHITGQGRGMKLRLYLVR